MRDGQGLGREKERGGCSSRSGRWRRTEHGLEFKGDDQSVGVERKIKSKRHPVEIEGRTRGERRWRRSGSGQPTDLIFVGLLQTARASPRTWVLFRLCWSCARGTDDIRTGDAIGCARIIILDDDVACHRPLDGPTLRGQSSAA